MTARNGWMPIETAPQDGTWFVTARFKDGEDPEYEVGRYEPSFFRTYTERPDGLFEAVDEKFIDWRGFNNFRRATHWTPLPEPTQ